jgi:hypothetical protein
VIGQTGDGHFSPVGAYDPVSDSVLILDTARFKYGPHWVKLPLLWEAMQPVDPSTGRPRGYVLLSFPGDDDDHETDAPNRHAARPPQSLLFQTRMNDYQVRRHYFDYLQSLRGNRNNDAEEDDVTWEQVVSYWTKNGSDLKYIWQMLKPQLTPINPIERDATTKLRNLLKDVLKPFQNTKDETCSPESLAYGNSCRSNLGRTMCLTPNEAIFVVYLASLQCEQHRRDIVGSVVGHCQTAQDQLLAEAELIRLALDVSQESIM